MARARKTTDGASDAAHLLSPSSRTHSHSLLPPTSPSKSASNPLRLMIFQLALTVCLLVLELVLGLHTKSLALTADAFHMLSDALALVVAIHAHRTAANREDHKMT